MFKQVEVKKESSSVRALAAATGVSSATISRIQNGHDFKVSVAQKLIPVLDECPCCGKSEIRRALKAIASLPTPHSEDVMRGHEDAYRAIEQLL